MRDLIPIFVLVVGGLLFLFLAVGSCIDHEEAKSRCERKEGTYVRTGKHTWHCLAPGTVIE